MAKRAQNREFVWLQCTETGELNYRTNIRVKGGIDDQSNLKLEVVDRKFRGTNFIYTLKTTSNKLIPVFVHSHHIHQHEVDEKFGIKRPINIDHIVCF